MSDTIASCRNCRWAEWTMTNHKPPRINARCYGKCTYVVALPILPKSMSVDLERKINSSRQVIWADRPHTDCPTWEAQQ